MTVENGVVEGLAVGTNVEISGSGGGSGPGSGCGSGRGTVAMVVGMRFQCIPMLKIVMHQSALAMVMYPDACVQYCILCLNKAMHI